MADSDVSRVMHNLARGCRVTSLLLVDLECPAPASASDGELVVHRCGPSPTHQVDARFALAVIDGRVRNAPPEKRRAALHQAVQHLAPSGMVAIPADIADLAEMGLAMGLVPDTVDSAPPDVNLFRRPGRVTVHDLLFEARSLLRRVTPAELAERLAGDRPPVVVDTRTHVDRERWGVIDGSIHVPRTVLEWHLDPVNGYAHPAVTSFDQPLVVVCNGGYSSSLGAANLLRLGFEDVTDLVGGMFRWIEDGLAVVPPTHSHIDL